MKKCPFRKSIIYNAGRNTGSGYPLEWMTKEEFENCIESECIMFYQEDIYSNYEGKYIQVGRCGFSKRRKHD